MRLGLKIDVDSYVGLKEGVPALLRLLDDYQAKASFFINFGPDNSGHWLRSGFRPRRWIRHLPRTSLLYGTLLPAPVLGRRLEQQIRDIGLAGHEIGIRIYHPVSWTLSGAHADAQQTHKLLSRAVSAATDLLGESPRAHSAAGWQANPYLFELEQHFGFDYASDCRGQTAFYPELQGRCSDVLQLPVTLPMLDELMLSEGLSADNVHEALFFASQKPLPQGQVFNLRAAIEGRDWLPIIERLLTMWKGSQREFKTLGELAAAVDRGTVARHQVGWDKPAGSELYLATQSIRINP